MRPFSFVLCISAVFENGINHYVTRANAYRFPQGPWFSASCLPLVLYISHHQPSQFKSALVWGGVQIHNLFCMILSDILNVLFISSGTEVCLFTS